MKIGDEYRFISETKTKSYTKGRIYKVISLEEWGHCMSDNENTPHFWCEPLFSQKFEKVSGPIRSVTRREIVPGKYGIVTIKECGFIHINAMGTPEQLREAAHTLNQIAEALEHD